MKDLILTPQGEKFESGFANKFGPLKGRSQKDLRTFLTDAYRSNREDYVAFFTDPPTLNALLTAKADAQLEGNAVYSPHPMHLPAGAEVKTAAPATDKARVNSGETATIGEGSGGTTTTNLSTASGASQASAGGSAAGSASGSSSAASGAGNAGSGGSSAGSKA